MNYDYYYYLVFYMLVNLSIHRMEFRFMVFSLEPFFFFNLLNNLIYVCGYRHAAFKLITIHG